MSALINIFESAFNDIHRQIKVESGLRIEEIENLDWENTLIYVNGFERKKEYKVKDNDVVTIRQFPSDGGSGWQTAGWFLMPVTSTIHFFASGNDEGVFNWIGREIGNAILDLFKQPDIAEIGQGEQIPTISGAKNRSGANQPIPLLIGESMYTPIMLGQNYTTISGTDGENQIFHGLYCLGYNDIDLKSVSLGIYKLSTDRHNGTSGSLDCENLEPQTITENKTFFINARPEPFIKGENTIRYTVDVEGYDTVSINSISSMIVARVYETFVDSFIGNGIIYGQEVTPTVTIIGNQIVITATVPNTKYFTVFGYVTANVTLKEKKGIVHYDRDKYLQALELQQSANENDEYEEVSLYPQKVVQENFGTELMHFEDADPLYLQPFSAKYPQKVELEVQFQNLIYFHSNGDKDYDTVELCVGYSLDGGVTFQPFNAFSSSGGITVTDEGTVTDSQGTYRKTKFRGKKNKMMRFVASMEFDFDDVFNIPEGTVKCKNNVIEFKIWRSSVDVSPTNSKHQYKCYFSAIRTWCYDYKETLKQYLDEGTEELVVQRPIIEKYRDMTARLGFEIRAGEEIKGTIDELNVLMMSRARYCTITVENGEKVYTWSDIDQTTPTNNPASLALMVLQHQMRREYAYIGEQGEEDKYFDMDSFGRFYEWCEQTDTELINSDGRKYTANGVLSRQMKTIDLVNQILSCGHGKLVIEGNRYAVLYDKPDELPVMVLNNQNILEAKSTKNFLDDIDGYSCKFIDCLNDYQEDTQIFVPKDLTDPESPNYKDPSDYKLESIEVPWITDVKRAYRLCMYTLACRKLRPESWEVKMSVDGNLLNVGSLVSYQSDVIAVGIGDGAQIADVITEEGDITSIVVDYGFNVTDTTKTYGIKVQHSDPINGVKVRVYELASFSTTGTKTLLTFAEPIDSATVIKPSVNDIVSFGIYDKITTDAIVLTKKSNNDGTFTFTLVPYQNNIYEAELGTIPEFETNVTSAKDAGVEVSEELPPVTLDQVGEVAEAVMNEGSDTPPSAPTNLTAVAEEIGVQLKWTPVAQNGLNNTIKHYVVEISKDAGETWTELGTTFNSDYMYVFKRTGEGADGYPEVDDFDDWLFRIKAVNIYGYSSSYVEEEVDTDNYGTWYIPELSVTTEILDRTVIITAVYGGSQNVYGKIKTGVRIKRNGNTYPVGDTEHPTFNEILGITPDSNWHTPEFSKNVQPSENYDYEDNYRKDTETVFETSSNKISHTLPLIGQTPRIFKAGNVPVLDSNNNSVYTKDVPDVSTIPLSPSAGDVVHLTAEQEGYIKDAYYLYENSVWVQVYSRQVIVPTSYLYEISMSNGVHTTYATDPIGIEALPTNIADIVHSHEHYKDLYVEKLSAINANIGMITQGGMGSFEDMMNCWALSDLSPEDSGTLNGVMRGTFRVGDENEYFRVTPHKRQDGTRYYSIELKAGNIELSSDVPENSTVDFTNGTFVYSADRLTRMKLAPQGITVQKYTGTFEDERKLWSDSSKIVDISAVVSDDMGNMIITNADKTKRPSFGFQETGTIYHFDDYDNPENEEVEEGQTATNPQNIDCGGEVVSTSYPTELNPFVESDTCFSGVITKNDLGTNSFLGNIVFFSKSEKIVTSGKAISKDGIVENAVPLLVGYNEAMRADSEVDPTKTVGEYIGLTSDQISNGIFG